MSRSPLSYPLNRHADMDAGGAADLQTDVMRFMAIISLCLVAIFALVQSLPAPTLAEPVEVSAETPTTLVAVPKPQTITQTIPPAAVAEQPPQQTKRTQAVARSPAHLPVAEKRPTPLPPTDSTPPLASSAPPSPGTVTTAPAADPAADEGFSLRFESDDALKHLVARNDIGFFALDGSNTQRLSVERNGVSFWSASNPREIYEMDESTVPTDVIRALRRGASLEPVQWGVTLPPKVRRDLDRFLAENSGGALIIGRDGRLRLEE